jgi:TRAP-type C4-dicarboxylate transport system permease small subunit
VGRISEQFRRVVRQARRVLELIVGLAFLFLAGAGGEVSFRLWKEHRNHPEQGMATFGLVASFTVLLIIFSLYSFARARSVR